MKKRKSLIEVLQTDRTYNSLEIVNIAKNDSRPWQVIASVFLNEINQFPLRLKNVRWIHRSHS